MAGGILGSWGVHGGGGGHAWQGACMGGTCGGGGACIVVGGGGWWGMHDRRNDHCSGRYASYWIAFLSIKNIEICVLFIAEDELVLSTKDFPDVRIGDIVEIYHPDRPQYRLMYFYFHC